MSDLDRTFADIAVLEAVLNDARAAGDEESVQKALRLLGGLWRRIVETPETRREVSGSLSIEEWLRRYRPRDGEGAEEAAMAMDWEAPDHEPGHG